MWLASPIWLTALVPWALVAVWLLRGRRSQAAVPFLALWQGPVTGRPIRHSIRVPSMAILALLASALLGIVAASQPLAALPAGPAAVPAETIVLIVDRGLGMSGSDPQIPTYRGDGQALADVLARARAAQPLAVELVPAGASAVLAASQLASWLESVPPTAVATGDLVRAVVRQRVEEGHGQIVVISDQELGEWGERVVRVARSPRGANTGISKMAARAEPSPQVMLRLTGRPAEGSMDVSVRTAGQRVVQRVQWLAGAADVTAFVDLAEAGESIEAGLVTTDAIAADNRSWLVRRGRHPRVEARDRLEPELQRLIGAYQRARPAEARSPRIEVVAGQAGPLPTAPTVVVAATPGQPLAHAARSVVEQHDITRSVNWDRVASSADVAPMPDGWRAVVVLGGMPAVAVREKPVRQVWVGGRSPDWPRNADYVIFWTAVFDWLAGAHPQYLAGSVGRLEGTWTAMTPTPSPAPEPGLWPGLYRGEDGGVVPVNAPDVEASLGLPALDWAAAIGRWRASGAGASALAPLLAVSAVVCLAIAASAWPVRT
jgi:hypothetical protein